MSVPSALESRLCLRVPVRIERWFLDGGVKAKRCPTCEVGKPQTEQTITLRADADRWPFAEAALVLFTVAALFGTSLAAFGLRETAFKLWPWAGWILISITSGAALAVGLLQVVTVLALKPLKIKVHTCARCAIDARRSSTKRAVLGVVYQLSAGLSFALAGAGLLWPTALCYDDDICLPDALSLQTTIANVVFGVFLLTMIGRWVLMIERGRREPALRKQRKSTLDLVVPQSWGTAFDEMRQTQSP